MGGECLLICDPRLWFADGSSLHLHTPNTQQTAYYAGTYLVFVADKAAAAAAKAAPIVPVLAPAKELLAHGDEDEPPVTGGGSVAGEQEGKDGEPNKGVGTPAAMMVKHGVSPIPSHTSTSSAASSPAAGSGQP